MAARLMPYLRCAWRAAIAMLARHHGFGRCDRAADAAHHRFPRARRHRGVAIDIDQSAGRRDVAQLGDVVLVVAERDEVEIALRRLVAHQELEALMRQRLLHRAQAVRPFGVSGRRDVVEAGLVGEEKRTHQSASWDAGSRRRLAHPAPKRKCKTQSMRSPGNGKGWSRTGPFDPDQFTRRMRLSGSGPIGPCALKNANSASAS
jgi:hypothetical protein